MALLFKRFGKLDGCSGPRITLMVRHPERMNEEHYTALFGAMIDACSHKEQKK